MHMDICLCDINTWRCTNVGVGSIEERALGEVCVLSLSTGEVTSKWRRCSKRLPPKLKLTCTHNTPARDICRAR